LQHHTKRYDRFRQHLANQLKAGFSRSAASVRPGRDSEPVVWSATSEDAVGQWLPRHEMRKALPCSSSFGPSRPHWRCGFGTTTAADFCPARFGFRRTVPGFRASPTPWSDDGPQAGWADLPG
jgi:hypothetical protein